MEHESGEKNETQETCIPFSIELPNPVSLPQPQLPLSSYDTQLKSYITQDPKNMCTSEMHRM